MKAVLPALARPLLEPRLPAGLDITWFASPDAAAAALPEAEIAWADMEDGRASALLAAKGAKLKWLSTIRAGLDDYDLPAIAARGTIVTNGTGLNAAAVAEYAVLGILAAAKRYDQVVRLADTHVWSYAAPGQGELEDTTALIIGYGTIGRMIGDRLAAFGVAITGVTRSGRDGTLGADDWRAKLGDYDWVILAAPATGATRAMIGAAELAAMKPAAWLINIARGAMVDNDALIAALTAKRIAGAFLDTVHPEPLPPEHPLWTAPNTLLSMHLSGRSQTTMFRRGAELFLANLDAFLAGRPMKNVVDPEAGY